MRFQSGVLGVVIVVAAVMATVLAGIVLNTHDTLVTKTEYERVTDISGLWEYTDEPEYLEYDPISNWTGFHLEGEDPIGGIEYATLANGSNRYAINNETWSGTRIYDARESMHTGPIVLPGVDFFAIVAPTYDGSYMERNGQMFANISGVFGEKNNSLSYDNRFQTLAAMLAEMDLNGSTHVIIEPMEGGVIFSRWIEWVPTPYQVFLEGTVGWPAYYLPTIPDIAKIDVSTGLGVATAYDSNGNVLWSESTSGVVGLASNGLYTDGVITETPGASNNDTRPDYYKVQYSYSTGVSTSYLDISKGVSLVPNTDVYWDNGHRNRVVTMTVHLEPGKAAQTSIVNYYDGATNQPIYINMDTTTSVQDIRVNVPTQGAISITGYNHAQIRMDTETNTLTVTPIVGWQGFTQYETLDALGKSVGLSALSQPGPITQMRMWANRTSFAQDMMSFGIVRTTVFMNTYDAVLKDATFDATRYFDYDLFRLNLVSFALYGDSITVAGNTYPVTDGEITIDGKQYKLNDVALEYDLRDPDAETVSFVTDTDKVVPLGTATPLTVNGIWYFTTWLDRGSEYTATETSFDLTGWAFDGSGPAILFFIGVLVLGTIVSTRLQAPTFLDLAVVGIAGFIGYILMG